MFSSSSTTRTREATAWKYTRRLLRTHPESHRVVRFVARLCRFVFQRQQPPHLRLHRHAEQAVEGVAGDRDAGDEELTARLRLEVDVRERRVVGELPDVVQHDARPPGAGLLDRVEIDVRFTADEQVL